MMALALLGSSCTHELEQESVFLYLSFWKDSYWHLFGKQT